MSSCRSCRRLRSFDFALNNKIKRSQPAAAPTRSKAREARGFGPLAAFQREQRLLRLQPPGKPGQFPRRANHPMTGRDDRNRIPAIRRTHCPHRARVADLLGDLAVAAGLAKGNGQQGPPDLLLKFRPGKIKVELERLACAREVFAQLLRSAHQDRVVRRFIHRAEAHPAWFVIFPEDGRQTAIVRYQLQLADG